MKIIIFLFLLNPGFLNLISAKTLEGGCGSHGGDSNSLEFYSFGKILLNEIELWDNSSKEVLNTKHFNLKEFQFVLENTPVFSTDEKLTVIKEDKKFPVEAKNYYESDQLFYIKLNRKLWEKTNSFNKKLGLVIHEYLGIMKSHFGHGEWDFYNLSSEVLDLFLKNSDNYHFSNQDYIDQLSGRFKKSDINNFSEIKQDFFWSCVEYSGIQNLSYKMLHFDAFLFLSNSKEQKNYGKRFPEITFSTEDISKKNRFQLSRKWIEKDPNEKENKKEESKLNNYYQEFIRLDESNNLIIENTSDSTYKNQSKSIADRKRGVISYLYCSKEISEAIQIYNAYQSALESYFNMDQTKDYEVFINNLKNIVNDERYKSCGSEVPLDGNNSLNSNNPLNDKSSLEDCFWVLDQVKNNKMVYEEQVIKQIIKKSNEINLWLDYLEHNNSKKHEVIADAFKKIFSIFIQKQTKLNNQFNLGSNLNNDSFSFNDLLNSLMFDFRNELQKSKKEFNFEANHLKKNLLRSSL